MKSIAPERCQRELAGRSEVPTLDLPMPTRLDFRVSIFKQRGDIAMVLRQIPNEMLPPEVAGRPRYFHETVSCDPEV